MTTLLTCDLCDGTGQEEVLGLPRGQYVTCEQCDGRGVYEPPPQGPLERRYKARIAAGQCRYAPIVGRPDCRTREEYYARALDALDAGYGMKPGSRMPWDVWARRHQRPTRGRRMFRERFYAFHCGAPCPEAVGGVCPHGRWVNVLVNEVSGYVSYRWPRVWRWCVHGPVRYRHPSTQSPLIRRLRALFPST